MKRRTGNSLMNSGKLRVIITLLALFTFGTGAFAGIDKEINRQFDVSEGGLFALDSEIGSVEVITGARDEILVEVRLQAKTSNEDRAQKLFNDFMIEFDQDGNELNIIAEYDGKRGLGGFFGSRKNRLKVKYLITVPPRFNLYIKTSGGSIHVGDLEGKVTARSSGGNLIFDNIDGEVIGKTSGGNIELTSCSGRAEVRTSGGSILIGKVEGDVIAKTSGGNIEVDEVMGTIDAGTSGGSVTAYISKQPKDDCQLRTSGGNVTVYLADNLSLDINAKTSGGRVKSNIEMKVRGSVSKRSLDVSLNGGGPELYLRTSGGSIYLKSL